MTSIHLTRRAALALGAIWLAPCAMAQTDSGVLPLIVPQPAGNPTDGIARKLQPLLQKVLGQTVVVENLPGAGGMLGVQRALNSPGGGPVLLAASQTEPILTPLSFAGARYKSEDVRPIALIGRAPYVLVGRPDLPAATLEELLELARKLKGKPLTHGNIGAGSMIHLLGEQWGRKSGVDLVQVPYKGVPPLAQDLIGGLIDVTFLPLGGSTRMLIESNKVRAFGVTSAAASKRLPKLPLISRQSPALGDFVYGTWAAIFVPRSLPEPAVQKLHAALAKVLENPDVKTYTTESGAEIAEPMTLAQLDRFYEGEVRTHRALAQAIGIKPQ